MRASRLDDPPAWNDARLSAPSPRILFLSPRYPFPPLRGDQTRAFHLSRALAELADVRVLCFGPAQEALPGGEPPLTAVPATALSRIGANLARPSPRIPMQTRLYLDGRMHAAVRRELPWADVLHVTMARMGEYVPREWDGHVHVDLMDAYSINMRTRAQGSRGPSAWAFGLEARLLERYEAALVGAAGSASVVSAADRGAPGLGRVAVVPNGVDTGAFAFREPGANVDPELVFFGNLGYFHNVGAAEFVATEVLPRVRERLPGARLRLVGARPAASVRRLGEAEGVEVTGEVPAIAPELARAGVAVLPIFSGSGIKNKVLEAFSVGLPVISNAKGMAGVEGARPGEEYLEAESAEEAAEQAVRVLTEASLRRALAGSARELVERSYTWEAQARRLLELYGHG